MIDARGATAVAIADGVRAGQVAGARRRRAVPRSHRAPRRRARLLPAGRRRRARGGAPTPSTPRARRAAIRARSPAFRWASRTSSARAASRPRARRRSCAASCRPTNRRSTARLAAAGGVMLGKLNMDEFAMGSSNENSAFKPVRNPWSLAHVPGRLVGRLGGGGRRVAVRRRRSAPTRAARSGSRPRCAASSASSRPTGASRATA